MKAIWLTVVGICMALILAGCGGSPEQPTATDNTSVQTAADIQDMPPICPVTGHVIEDVETAPKAVYEGKRYYFQCPSCKAEFDRDPAKYTASFDEKVAAAKKESDKSEESDEMDKSESSH